MASPKLTLVTGLWDIGRGGMDNTSQKHDWARSRHTYAHHLERLLEAGLPTVVFGDAWLGSLVSRFPNAAFVHFAAERFQTEFKHFAAVDAVRRSPTWFDQPTALWLKSSPQALLPLYLPIQFSKLAFLRQASKENVFGTERFYWVDAGIAKNHTTTELQEMVPRLLAHPKFMLLWHKYTDNTEIHGFLRSGAHRYCGGVVDHIAKGFLFGGDVSRIEEIYAAWDALIGETIAEGLLGVDETLMTILAHRKPEFFDLVPIGGCDHSTRYL